MRARWLTPLLALPLFTLAAQLPHGLAPHEANACSGAGPYYYPDRDSTSVDSAAAVATDTLIVRTKRAEGSPGSNVDGPAKVSARVETSDGTPVPLARNDFATAPPKSFDTAKSVLRPVTPFTANADYFLVLEGLSPATSGGPTSESIGFRTGSGPRALPPAPVPTQTTPAVVQDDIPLGSPQCCAASCSSPKCAPKGYAAREVRLLSWQADAQIVQWLVEVESTRVTDETLWEATASGRRRTVPVANVPILLAAGEHACVRVSAVDAITGDTSASDALCFDGPGTLPEPKDPCPGLFALTMGAGGGGNVNPQQCSQDAQAACDAWRAAHPPTGAGGAGAGGAGGAGMGGAGSGGSPAVSGGTANGGSDVGKGGNDPSAAGSAGMNVGGTSAGGASGTTSAGSAGAGASPRTPSPAEGCSVGDSVGSDSPSGAGALLVMLGLACRGRRARNAQRRLATTR